MNIFKISLSFFTLALLPSSIASAQALIKEKIEIVYSLSERDSIVRSQKTSNYDEQGRLILMQHYHYHQNSSRLVKEEKSYFNSQNSILTENIISYPEGKDPVTQKMITTFLDYQAKEADSKRSSRQFFNEYGEIAREDTLTYNANNQLIEQCDYDYRGNTSLFCNFYTYNKEGMRAKWITYSRWTTINGKGAVVEKQDKRRNFRYFYNKENQLVKIKGKDYSAKILQKISYDKNSFLEKDYRITKRKIKTPVIKKTTTVLQDSTNQSVAKSNQTKTKRFKNTINREEETKSYQNGRLIEEIRLFNKVELNKTEKTYQDTLVKKIDISIKTLPISSSEYTYEGSILSEKTEKKYDSNGNPRYLIITNYNKQGLAVEEKQVMNEKILSRLESSYDEKGNLVLQSLSFNNGLSFEKTMYIYKYY